MFLLFFLREGQQDEFYVFFPFFLQQKKSPDKKSGLLVLYGLLH